MTTPDLRPDQETERSSRAPALAALGVVVLVLVVAFGSWLVRDDQMWSGSDHPTAVTSSSPGSSPGSSVVQLRLPAREAGRCMPVDAENLSRAETAFDGEVLDVTDDSVTLAVREWYAGGGGAAQARLDLARAPASLAGYFAFEKDRRYLVSSNDGAVLVCGFSGPYSAGLEQVYQDAFGDS